MKVDFDTENQTQKQPNKAQSIEKPQQNRWNEFVIVSIQSVRISLIAQQNGHVSYKLCLGFKAKKSCWIQSTGTSNQHSRQPHKPNALQAQRKFTG